jgi:histidinol-phosphate aminotransferase
VIAESNREQRCLVVFQGRHKHYQGMETSQQFPSHIAALHPYVPGRPIQELARKFGVPGDRIVKLASNENPLGASPMAKKAIADLGADLSRYPDNDCTLLTETLAAVHEVPADWLVIGSGSESVLGVAAAAILTVGRRTLYPQYSFQAYVNAAQRVGAGHIVAPAPELTVDLTHLRRGLAEQPAQIYIANPGNPTGTWLEPDRLHDFIQSVPAHIVVILDEAYFEFLAPEQRGDSIGWVRKFPNLLVTRTFSKAYGLAGLRVGYGVAQPALAAMLRRVRAPFTVTEWAQIGAAAAVHDHAFLAATLQNNTRGSAALRTGLDHLRLRYLPSATNFVLAEVGDGKACAAALEQRGFIVRPVVNYGLPQWVRLSIGSPSEMQGLLDALRASSWKSKPEVQAP